MSVALTIGVGVSLTALGLASRVVVGRFHNEGHALRATAAVNGVSRELFEAASEAVERGAISTAAEYYSQGLKSLPGLFETLLRRGYCYLELGLYEDAQADFDQARALSPASAAPLVALGELQVARHRYEEAIDLFDSALSIAPSHARAHYQRGRALYSTHQLRQAFLEIQRASRLAPGVPEMEALYSEVQRALEQRIMG